MNRSPVRRASAMVGGALALLAGCAEMSSPEEIGRGAPPHASSTPWFQDVTEASGVAFTHVSGAAGDFLFPEIMGGGAALVDLDGSGALDLYLVQSGYLIPGDRAQPGNQLYRGRGDGTFEDATAQSGADDRGYGMGVAAGDFNHSGLIDLYVTNVGPNALLRNEGSFRFMDVSDASGTGDPGWGTSAAFVDIDQDGLLDLFVVNYISWAPERELRCLNGAGARDYCSPNSYGAPAPDVLFRNLGNETFEDVSVAAGLRTAFGNGLGVVCLDFDGDGWIDLFVANDQNENQLWRNQGDGTLQDVAARTGTAVDRHGEPKAGMGTHAVDYFDSGRIDILVVNLRNQSDTFYRNEGRYFEDATTSVGLGTVVLPFTRFGVALLDFDHDGRLDYFAVNGRVVVSPDLPMYGENPYAEPNLLLRGDDRGRLNEVLPRGGTDPLLIGNSRAAAFGDIDGDGALDVVIVNIDGSVDLLRNQAAGDRSWVMFRAVDRHGRDALHATIEVTLPDGRRLRRDVRSAYSYQAANDFRVHIGLGRFDRVHDVRVRWPGGATETFGELPAQCIHLLREGFGSPE